MMFFMNENAQIKISRALGLLALLIFLLIVVGGLVRNLGAGLSCPDWPLCQGRIIPEFDLRVFADIFIVSLRAQ